MFKRAAIGKNFNARADNHQKFFLGWLRIEKSGETYNKMGDELFW